MIRILAVALLAVFAFVLSLAGALAATGNLNGDAVQRLISGAPPPEMPTNEAPPAMDTIGDLAAQLKDKERELAAREAELNERERRIAERVQQLEQLQTQLKQLDTELSGKLAEGDTERGQRLKTVANTIAEMKADKAAERLAGMPVDEVAEIMRQIEKEADRAKIIESMDTEIAMQVLRALQEAPVL